MAENKGGAPAAAAPQEAPSGGTAAKSAKRKMTKMDAVRKALAAMGRDAKPSEMRPYIKKKFGVVMTTDHISTYKGDILKKEAEAAAKAHPPAPAKPATPPAPARREGGQGSGSGSVLLEDVLTTKALLDRIGAERLRILINGLAK